MSDPLVRSLSRRDTRFFTPRSSPAIEGHEFVRMKGRKRESVDTAFKLGYLTIIPAIVYTMPRRGKTLAISCAGDRGSIGYQLGSVFRARLITH